MQRWFYANEESICELKKQESSTATTESVPEIKKVQPKRPWRFCVSVENYKLHANEALAISGDCDELGNWIFCCCIVMKPMYENSLDQWHVIVNIPAERDISYRYLIVAIDDDCDQMIVRFFESHRKPRKVLPKQETIVDVCEDTFGFVNNIQKIERGWLTTETIIQFKFFHAPFSWRKTEMSSGTYYVKVTPYFRRNLYDCLHHKGYYESSSKQTLFDYMEPEKNEPEKIGDQIDVEKDKKDKKTNRAFMKCENPMRSFTKLDFKDSEHTMILSHGSRDCTTEMHESMNENSEENNRVGIKLSTAFAFNEVVNTHENRSYLIEQPFFGIRCNDDDLVTFHLTIGDFDNTVYLIELFKYSRNAAQDEPPYRVGYRYVLPEDFRTYKHACMEVPIICASKHRPMGLLKFGFSIILPHPSVECDLSVSYLRHWNMKRRPMVIGHRGQGPTYITPDNNIVIENTIYSFKQAVTNGADMVEFDVHLTKDLIPVVFHDFNVKVAKDDEKLLQDFDNVEIPLGKFTHNDLLNLKIVKDVDRRSTTINISEAKQRRKIFPTLAEVLRSFDENVGFDIELKFPQRFCNRSYEGGIDKAVERNLFTDRILEIVFENAKDRRIIFCSFDADVCTHIRFKQNRYPVMLLIRKDGDECVYLDPRVQNAKIASNFVCAMEFLGVVLHKNTIINDDKKILEFLAKKLVVFTWGIEKHEEVQIIMNFGAQAIIFDRIDIFAKNQRESAGQENVEIGSGD